MPFYWVYDGLPSLSYLPVVKEYSIAECGRMSQGELNQKGVMADKIFLILAKLIRYGHWSSLGF